MQIERRRYGYEWQFKELNSSKCGLGLMKDMKRGI